MKVSFLLKGQRPTITETCSHVQYNLRPKNVFIIVIVTTLHETRQCNWKVWIQNFIFVSFHLILQNIEYISSNEVELKVLIEETLHFPLKMWIFLFDLICWST